MFQRIPRRFKIQLVPKPQKWWQKLLRRPNYFTVQQVEVFPDSPEWDTATYQEVIILGRPFMFNDQGKL